MNHIQDNLRWILGIAALSVAVVLTLGAVQIPPATVQFLPPSFVHFAGTDQFGRDVFLRTLASSRTSLTSALISTVLSVLVGTTLGLIAGVYGGIADWIIARLVESVLAIPALLFALFFVVLFKPEHTYASIAVGVALMPTVIRVTRIQTMSIVAEPYVDATRALGAGRVWVISRHVIPNILVSVISLSGTLFAWSLLNLASLDFLGIIADQDTLTWGRGIAVGAPYIRVAPWIVLCPGLMLMGASWFVMVAGRWLGKLLHQ